jgi:multiple sugar transport system substrate-binding protein
VKKYLVGLLLIALVLSGVTVFAASKVTLRYGLWDSNQKSAMEAAIKEFMKSHPNITVKVELTEWNDYWTKINTGVASRTLPDVFWGHLAYFSGLITKGALMDLTPYIKKDKVDLSVYYKNLVANWNYKGKQYGIPKDWDTIAVFYNKDLFDKAKIPYPGDWSWNPQDGGEFLQVLQKLTLDKDGKNPTENGFDKNKIAQYGICDITGSNSQTGWLNLIWMNGGTGVLDKPYGQKMVIDQPKAVAALQFYSDLSSKYCVAPLASGSQGGINGWELFTAQKAAMIMQGSWMLSAARNNLKFNWDIAYLPKGPAGRYSCFNGLAHNIYARTKHPKEAWELAKWMDGYKSQKMIAERGIVFPAIKSLVPVYLTATKEMGPEHIKYFIDETNQTGLWPMHVNWNQISDITTRELDLAIAGSQSAKKATLKIKSQTQLLLK